MGIYWCSVDDHLKQRIEPPRGFSIKSPGIFHPRSPFPGMVMMMNSRGNNFELINDGGWDERYYEYIDITEIVYQEYLQEFPWAKDEIYEPHEEQRINNDNL